MINLLKNLSSERIKITSLADATALLCGLTENEQRLVIAAIYTGREHIHHNKISPSVVFGIKETLHIPISKFPEILYEKSGSIPLYLTSLLRCSENSVFDIEQLLK